MSFFTTFTTFTFSVHRRAMLRVMLRASPIASLSSLLLLLLAAAGPTPTSAALTLDELWDLYVGPVNTTSINTTLEPVPIPSELLTPPPPLYYPPPPFPGRFQVPLRPHNDNWAFPSTFWRGVAGSAFQTEGAVKADGRGPSIWDVLTHIPAYVKNGDNADVADNSYYQYKQDIARIAALGLNTYAFSVSWSRIMPYGSGHVNEAGLQHYDDLINTCLAYGITPVVTLYHWDLPLNLQLSYGGWLGSQVIADFTDYARVAFTRWSSKVQYWVTLNEPAVFCNYKLPPGRFNDTATAAIPPEQHLYICAQNTLLAHSAAYHLGKSINASLVISFKNNGGYNIPANDNPDTAAAVQRAYDFNDGLWATPIFLTGDYPTSVKDHVSAFLPNFTADQSSRIKGTSDIFMIDSYGTGGFITVPRDGGLDACLGNASHPAYPACFATLPAYPGADYWPAGPAVDPCASWLHYGTDWVPAMLKNYQDTYKPGGGIVVSEFGIPEPYEGLRTDLLDIVIDPLRSRYYREYMSSILMAIAEGINVVGTLAWSIMDNFEWDKGYECRFGIQHVNYSTQERNFKASAFEYVNMFKIYQEQ